MLQGMYGTSKLLRLLVPFFFRSGFSTEIPRIALSSLLQEHVTVFTSLDATFENALAGPLENTEDSICGMQYMITNKRIIQILKERAEAGVPIKIVLDSRSLSVGRSKSGALLLLDEHKKGLKGLQRGIKELIQKEGIEVYLYNGKDNRGLMHCKVFIMRGVNTGIEKKDVVHTGSANCTVFGLKGINCEVAQLMTSRHVVEDYARIYERVKGFSERVLMPERTEVASALAKKKSK